MKVARTREERILLKLIAGTALAFVIAGFIVQPPQSVLLGIGHILSPNNILVTDFIELGGVGGAFAQAGLLTLVGCALYYLTGAKVDGAAVGCLYMLLGFALFGKTLINVWPIMLGVALYARYKREPVREIVTVAIFATALSPIFTQVAFNSALSRWISVPLGFFLCVLLGFVIPSIARQLFRAHNGFTLYNMGFVAGILGSVVVAVLSSYGLRAQPAMVWSSGSDKQILVMIVLILVSLVAAGLQIERNPWKAYRDLHRQTGQAPTDFLAASGFGATLLNMASVGVIATCYVLFIGADLNGPVLGGIVSVIGFGACGKHSLNILPIFVGVILGALLKPYGLTDPAVVWAALFGTCLAPMAGRFGPQWGILAGFLLVSVGQTTGVLSAGLNLYGNGFAAGLIASVLSAVALSISKQRRGTDQPQEVQQVPAA
ncbi:DUF1576 domain-containing protein [Glutamicibacter sp.]|uniref:DUF1576 domain-containing protein n=1 Tax=Glutamicibacter sp. TaxID=1931995 RepID=UPI0028BE79BE|nr:DUF1576 domain-containing protein [Glutamicibacter sp.]